LPWSGRSPMPESGSRVTCNKENRTEKEIFSTKLVRPSPSRWARKLEASGRAFSGKSITLTWRPPSSRCSRLALNSTPKLDTVYSWSTSILKEAGRCRMTGLSSRSSSWLVKTPLTGQRTATLLSVFMSRSQNI
jgi:hypothetical protein